MQIATNQTAADRVEFVDVLRGFALSGVFAANLLIFSGHTYMTEAQLGMLPTAASDHVVHLLELIFIENKFMGLFSFLFGVSFWLFLDRAAARGDDGKRLFYRRVIWLFVIGAIHAWLFWLWDILRFYALWGLLLPLFIRLSNRALLGSALFCAVLAPALIGMIRVLLLDPVMPRTELNSLALTEFSSGSYEDVLRVNWIYDWDITFSINQIGYQLAVFGRLLLGLFAARLALHTDLQQHRKLFLKLVLIGIVIGIPLNVVIAGEYLDSLKPAVLLQFSRRLVSQTGYLTLTLAYAAGLALLFQVASWKKFLMVFAPVGRMALTCYLLQTLFGLWLFYGFMPGPNLMGKVGPTWLIVVWIAGYSIQVLFASLWLQHFRFGPAEWLWRSLTYWKIQPFRRPAVSTG